MNTRFFNALTKFKIKFFAKQNKSSIFAEKNEMLVELETLQRTVRKAFYRSAKEYGVFNLLKKSERAWARSIYQDTKAKLSIEDLYKKNVFRSVTTSRINHKDGRICVINQYVNAMLSTFLGSFELAEKTMYLIGKLAHIASCAALVGEKVIEEDKPNLHSFAVWLYLEHHRNDDEMKHFEEWFQINRREVEKMFNQMSHNIEK